MCSSSASARHGHIDDASAFDRNRLVPRKGTSDTMMIAVGERITGSEDHQRQQETIRVTASDGPSGGSMGRTITSTADHPTARTRRHGAPSEPTARPLTLP